MLSSICRQLSVSCSLPLSALKTEGPNISKVLSCSLSSQARAQDEAPEVVSVLRLNMLHDNPGANKQVKVTSCATV